MSFILSSVDEFGNIHMEDALRDPTDKKLNTLLRIGNDLSDQIQELHNEITGYIRPKSERCKICTSQFDLYRIECNICDTYTVCKKCLFCQKSKCKTECPDKQCSGKLKRKFNIPI